MRADCVGCVVAVERSGAICKVSISQVRRHVRRRYRSMFVRTEESRVINYGTVYHMGSTEGLAHTAFSGMPSVMVLRSVASGGD